MLKVKVKKEFRDKHTGVIHPINEVFEATEKRVKEILSVAPLVEVIEPSKKESEKPANKGRKKADK